MRRPSLKEGELSLDYQDYQHGNLVQPLGHSLAPALDARCWLAVLAALGQLRKKYRIGEEDRVEAGMFSGGINNRRGPADTPTHPDRAPDREAGQIQRSQRARAQ